MEITPARISALEAQVSALTDSLAMAVALLGQLGAHEVMTTSPLDTTEKARARLKKIAEGVFEVHAQMKAIWPDMPQPPPLELN